MSSRDRRCRNDVLQHLNIGSITCFEIMFMNSHSNYVEDFLWHSNFAPFTPHFNGLKPPPTVTPTFCRAALMTLLVLIAWRAPRTKPPVFVGPVTGRSTPSRLSRCQKKGYFEKRGKVQKKEFKMRCLEKHSFCWEKTFS